MLVFREQPLSELYCPRCGTAAVTLPRAAAAFREAAGEVHIHRE